MNNPKVTEESISRIAMTYGAYVGSALILITLIFALTSSLFNSNLQFLNYIIIIIGIYYSTKKYRDEYLNGYISYSRAFGFGTLTIFYSSLLLAFFVYILYKVISPELIGKYITILEEQFLQTGMEEERVESLTALYRNFMTPFVLAISEIFGKTLLGFIFSLLISLVLKKENGGDNSEINTDSKINESSQL